MPVNTPTGIIGQHVHHQHDSLLKQSARPTGKERSNTQTLATASSKPHSDILPRKDIWRLHACPSRRALARVDGANPATCGGKAITKATSL